MTCNVVAFPDRNGLDAIEVEREWSALAEGIRIAIYQKAGTAHMADWIIADMRPRWEAARAKILYEVDDSAIDAVLALKNEVEDAGRRAVIQIFVLEVDLYLAIFGGPPMQVTFEVPKPTG